MSIIKYNFCKVNPVEFDFPDGDVSFPFVLRQFYESSKVLGLDLPLSSTALRALLEREHPLSLKNRLLTWVYCSSIAEHIGPVSIESLVVGNLDSPFETANKEIVNDVIRLTSTLYMLLDDVRERCSSSVNSESIGLGYILLSVEFIRNVHGSLLPKDGTDFAGKWRTCCAKPAGFSREYARPEDIETLLYGLVDVYNKSVLSIASLDCPYQRVEDMVKLAAVFYFDFLDIHPFVDGNGRTARLLLCLVMSCLGVFPFTLWSYDDRKLHRENYLHCFDRCHLESYEPPKKLALLIAKSLNASSQSLLTASDCYFHLPILSRSTPVNQVREIMTRAVEELLSQSKKESSRLVSDADDTVDVLVKSFLKSVEPDLWRDSEFDLLVSVPTRGTTFQFHIFDV